jgi:hypothetical protein
MCRHRKKPDDPGDKTTRRASVIGAVVSAVRLLMDLIDRWKS